MSVGVFASSLADHAISPAEALQRASAGGYRSCYFGSAFDLSPDLSSADIERVRELAAALNIEVVVGSPSTHPYRMSVDRALLRAGEGDPVRGFLRTLRIASSFSDADCMTIIGRYDDRWNRIVPWRRQLEQWAAFMKSIRTRLLDLGLRIAVKTHEEISSFEALELVDTVGSDVLSIGFDPVNVIVSGEDPVQAAARVAGVCSHVYIDDAVFGDHDGIARRLLCPLDEGIIDWRRIVSIIGQVDAGPRYWIELHRAQFDVRPSDSRWTTSYRARDDAERVTFERLVSGDLHRTETELSTLRANQVRPAQRLHATSDACADIPIG